jgi:hypothetical protein
MKMSNILEVRHVEGLMKSREANYHYDVGSPILMTGVGTFYVDTGKPLVFDLPYRIRIISGEALR